MRFLSGMQERFARQQQLKDHQTEVSVAGVAELCVRRTAEFIEVLRSFDV